MTVSETLAAAWKALRATDCSRYLRATGVRSDEYSVFAAISHPAGLIQLIFVVDKKYARTGLDLETKAFTLQAEPYIKGGQVQVRLGLTHPSFADLYQHLCTDVTSAFLSAATEELAVEALRARVAHWQRLCNPLVTKGSPRNDRSAFTESWSFSRDLYRGGKQSGEGDRRMARPVGNKSGFHVRNCCAGGEKHREQTPNRLSRSRTNGSSMIRASTTCFLPYVP